MKNHLLRGAPARPASGRIFLLWVSVFLLSVLVRLPLLGRPLGGHHEWLTATSLVNIRAFYEQGFARLHFSPCLSYSNPADKNIAFFMNLRDPSGNMYYLSFPPFALILPAAVFRLLHIYPSALALQTFNLIFHFITAIFVYLIVSELTRNSSSQTKSPFKILGNPAALSFLIYMFAPGPMWFQSNVYMSDMFVQPFFAIGIYLFLKSMEPGSFRRLFAIASVLNLFLMTYTEWTGVFFGTVLLAYGAIARKKQDLPLFLLHGLACTTAVALTGWQYAQISGFRSLFDYEKQKFLFRTGDPRFAWGHLSLLNLNAWLTILMNYMLNFLPFLVLLGVLAVRFLRVPRDVRNKTPVTDRQMLVILLCLAPVLLHHLVFFSFTCVHDFAALKGGLFVAIATGLIFSWTLQLGLPAVRTNYLGRGIILATLASVLQYYALNFPGAGTAYRTIGEEILRQARNDEVVFIDGVGDQPDPQYMAYARRNLSEWKGIEKAHDLMRQDGVKRGILFKLNQGRERITTVQRIDLQ